ncbi:MAG: GDSL-type esterase/lipase family protein [Planctomycetota bacterium]
MNALRQRTRRRRWPLVLLLLAGLLGAAELVTRAAGLVKLDGGVATAQQADFNAANMFESAPQAALSYRNRPLAEAQLGALSYRHDARGFRVTPAAGGGPIVAFLGDSTTYGLGLAEEQTLPAQTALALAGLGHTITPWNLGVCGYSTAQELLLYEAQREALAAAEVVVLVVFPNDFVRGVFRWDAELKLMYLDPLPLPHGLKSWLFRSALYRGLVSGLGRRLAARGELDPLNPDNHGPTLAALEQLAESVRRDGKRLLVAHLPAMERLDPYLFAEPVRLLAETCARLQIPYVDLLDDFLAEREVQIAAYEARGAPPVDAAQRAAFLSQYWLDPRDHHLNARATRLAAEALARALAPELAGR